MKSDFLDFLKFKRDEFKEKNGFFSIMINQHVKIKNLSLNILYLKIALKFNKVKKIHSYFPSL